MALKQFLKEEGYDEIIIESSPFLRTMMTASQIAKGLGMNKIKVNYLFSELLASYLFEYDPLPHAAIRTKDKNKIVATYLDGVEYEDDGHFLEHAKKLYPESKP